MNTYETLIIKTGKTRQTILNRINALGIPENYEVIRGKTTRVFTKEEADAIVNYQPKKPGRKPWKK